MIKAIRSIMGGEVPAPDPIVIANSVTVKVGDRVKLIAGGVDIADAVTDRGYGVCVGIVTPSGVALENATSGTDYDG